MRKLILLQKGIITGLTMIALSLFFFYSLKQPPESSLQYIIYIVYTIGIGWSILAFSGKSTKAVTFRDYFSAGFRTFILVTLLMVVFTFAFYRLNPQILEAKITLNNELAIREGGHTPAEIESNAKQMRSIFMPMMLMIKTFMYLFLGALLSAVISGTILQMKKN